MNIKFAHFVMYASLLSIPLAGSAAVNPSPSDALAKSATGPGFYNGESEFHIVPGAIVVSSDALRKSESSSRSLNAVASVSSSLSDVAQIGDYVIVLPSASSEKKSQARDLSAADSAVKVAPYGVAVSERSGQPVLVSPSVTVFTSPAIGKALANKTGGKVIFASELASRTVIGYADVDTAVNALATLSADGSVNATLDIIESFKKTQ